MKRFILFMAVFVIFNFISNAQEEVTTEETTVAEVKDKPVKSPFETAVLIDFPTTVIPSKGSFQLMIHHRFGTINNGISDIYGIYAPSNINMTFDYSLFDFLQVGFSSEKNNKIQDIHGKLNLLTQTRSGNIPVSVSIYSMAGIGARSKEFYGKTYKFMDRLLLFEQLIISRKFSERLSLLTGASWSHFNAVSYDKGEKHDHVGIHFGGRCKIWSSNSFIFEYTYPFKIAETEELNPPKQGFSAGLEFGTSTHGFQVFASNYQELNPIMNVSRTQNDFFKGDLLLGFNITIRF